MTKAGPFHHDVAEGPDKAHAMWAQASDGVRLRLAIWPGNGNGTVLLFPGRTEYIEKYGRAAGDLAKRGFAVIAIDWRGQGLADRALDDRNTGHVMHFADYQMDVDVMVKTARAQGLPEPYYLLAHSMGGCIGLRALMNGLPVRAAAFTAPMWGIAISGLMRPVAWVLAAIASRVGLGHRYTPGTKPVSYVGDAAFEDNFLTTDPDMFAYMQRQIAAHPELALGGPSMRWLYEALRESRAMAALPSPSLATLTYLGTNERVVDTAPIHDRMRRWPGGQLRIVEGAEHEVLMERPDIRTQAFDEIAAHFSAHG
jgi:lysophospholipase